MKYEITAYSIRTKETKSSIVDGEYNRDVLVASLMDSMEWIVRSIVPIKEE